MADKFGDVDYYNLERSEIVDVVPPSARRVLDIGCGAGGLGRALK
jgi:2-polyprenyl-3-methyl-5-hydroxy-6-metoxy-1,4-benzoquinol methylase